MHLNTLKNACNYEYTDYGLIHTDVNLATVLSLSCSRSRLQLCVCAQWRIQNLILGGAEPEAYFGEGGWTAAEVQLPPPKSSGVPPPSHPKDLVQGAGWRAL